MMVPEERVEVAVEAVVGLEEVVEDEQVEGAEEGVGADQGDPPEDISYHDNRQLPTSCLYRVINLRLIKL